MGPPHPRKRSSLRLGQKRLCITEGYLEENGRESGVRHNDARELGERREREKALATEEKAVLERGRGGSFRKKSKSVNAAAGSDRQAQAQAQALSNLFKRPQSDKEDIRRFHQQTEKDKRALLALLGEKKNLAKEKQAAREAEITELLQRAFHPATIGDDASPAHYTTCAENSSALNPAYEFGIDILNRSKALVAAYDKIEKMIDEAAQQAENRNTGEKWAEEIVGVEMKLALGRKKALRSVRRIIGVDEKETGCESTSAARGEEGTVDGKQAVNMPKVLGLFSGVCDEDGS